MDWVRRPAVSGKFYPGEAEALTKMLQAFFASESGEREQAREKQKPFAAIAPHAGYIYSGKIAAGIYRHLSFQRPSFFSGPITRDSENGFQSGTRAAG